MALSPHTTPRFATFVASALAAAAIGVPAAQASDSQSKYGPPDPWAFRFLNEDPAPYRLITENSASQSRLDRVNAQQDHLISDNSPSQNRGAAAPRDYGPPDPWMFHFMHHDPLISENSASQNRPAQAALKPTAVASAPTDGLDWLDAAVGAGGTLALTVLATGAVFAVRHTRTVAARR
jgi:hypothetical protein